MMKKLILVSALLGSMLIAGAAELIHLKMDFSRPGWNEILSPQGGETTVRDGELSLSAGSSVVTPYFPLTPGELEVRGIAAGNLTLRIHFLRLLDHPAQVIRQNRRRLNAQPLHQGGNIRAGNLSHLRHTSPILPPGATASGSRFPAPQGRKHA